MICLEMILKLIQAFTLHFKIMSQLSTTKIYKTSSGLGGVFSIKFIKEENQIIYFKNVSPISSNMTSTV